MTTFKKTFQALAVTTALTFGGFAVTSASAEDVHAIDTLKEAVAVGVENNPEAGVVENSRRATDEELRQAKALYYPSIDLDADTGFEWTEDGGTRARTGDDNELYRSQVGLTLTQMLFDGFDTRYENQRQYHRVRSASHRVRETEEFVGLDVVEAYLDVTRQRQLLSIARENVSQHVTILRRIEDGADAGRSTRADVEQVRARLAASKANEANVVEALRLAESAFNREVGDMPGNLKMPVAPVDALAANVEEEVKHILTHSPTLDIFEADVNVAEAEWRGTGSSLYPQVDLQLAGRYADDVGGVDDDDQSASALVTMDWNLFRGGADKARVKEFVYAHAEAKERRNDAARGVEDDARQTWAQMLSAGERAKQFTAQAAANQQVVRAYMDQFELDRRTLLDVLDAQNELFVSRSNALNNEVLEMFAVYRLLSLKGELLPTLDIAYQAEVDPHDNY